MCDCAVAHGLKTPYLVPTVEYVLVPLYPAITEYIYALASVLHRVGNDVLPFHAGGLYYCCVEHLVGQGHCTNTGTKKPTHTYYLIS